MCPSFGCRPLCPESTCVRRFQSDGYTPEVRRRLHPSSNFMCTVSECALIRCACGAVCRQRSPCRRRRGCGPTGRCRRWPRARRSRHSHAPSSRSSSAPPPPPSLPPSERQQRLHCSSRSRALHGWLWGSRRRLLPAVGSSTRHARPPPARSGRAPARCRSSYPHQRSLPQRRSCRLRWRAVQRRLLAIGCTV